MVKFRRWGILEWLALILGLIGAGTAPSFLMWFVPAFAEGRINLVDWPIVIGTGLLALGSVAIAWKWPLIGGVMLIAEGLPPIGLFVWAVIQSVFFLLLFSLFLIPGLPLLASGVLFILSWRKGRRPPKETGG